jgi:hypothetical protein
MHARPFHFGFIVVTLLAGAIAAHAATIDRPMLLVASADLGGNGDWD